MPGLISRVIRSMEKIAPLSLAETSWDNVGLLLEAPYPRSDATKVFLTIDLTAQVLEECLSDPLVGVIVSYHPPLFKSMKKLVLSDEKQAIALKCAALGISIYSPHTALDSCSGGINDWLAKGLGAGQTYPISPVANPPFGQDLCGSGRIHTLDTEIDLYELVTKVKSYLNLKHVRLAVGSDRMVKTIGICAGSGGSVLNQLKSNVYLTGEMSHHEVLAAVASGISVILTEHSNSERGYLSSVLQPRLQSSLRLDQGLGIENDVNIEVIVSSVDKDPILPPINSELPELPKSALEIFPISSIEDAETKLSSKLSGRKSLYQSSLEGLDIQKLINQNDHSIADVLDSHFEEFLKIYHTVSDKHKNASVGDDEVSEYDLPEIMKSFTNGIMNFKNSNKQHSRPKTSSKKEKRLSASLDSRKLSASQETIKSEMYDIASSKAASTKEIHSDLDHNSIEFNNALDARLSSPKSTRRYSKQLSNSNQDMNCISSSSIQNAGFHELGILLEEAYQTLLNDETEDFEDQRKSYINDLSIIMDEKLKVTHNLQNVKNQIILAKKNAAEKEKENAADAMKGFSGKFENTIIHNPKVILSMDSIEFEKNGLLHNPIVEDDEEEIPLDQKIKDLLSKIKSYQISRTNSGIVKKWFIDRNLKMISIGKAGVLETESEQVKAVSRALEIPLHGAVNTKMHYSDEERKILNHMNARVNYLKNPRFNFKSLVPKPFEKMNFQEVSLAESDFLPSNLKDELIYPEPAKILFTDYKPGNIYTKILSIRNKSSNSHRFRVSPLPPYNYARNFTYTLVKSPTPDDGLVAPGMSCSYLISFIPDSLINFSFLLQVATEMGNLFLVPIYARRESPILTLPESLHCGPCRAGYISERSWEFQNNGGPGRFIIVDDDDSRDPWEIIRDMDPDLQNNNLKFKNGPFEISPAYFSLDHDEKTTIHIKYFADHVDQKHGKEITLEKLDNIIVKIGCDNGQVLKLPVLAISQMADLKIVKAQTEDGSIYYHDEIPKLDSFDMNIEFGTQNPHAVSTCLITVKNETQLKLPFNWIVYDNPGTKEYDDSLSQSDNNDSFQIIPSKGWIGADMEITFEINFNPQYVREYDVFSKLILCDDLKRAFESKDTTETALLISCKGEGIPYNITVSPPIINVPETIYTASSFATTIRLYNNSVSRIAFEWHLEGIDQYALEILMSESSGTIQSNSFINIEIVIKGKFPRKINGALVCLAAHGLGPKIVVPISAEVVLHPQTIVFDSDMIDFGLLALGTTKSEKITITNKSESIFAWQVRGYSRSYQEKEADCFMIFEPGFGIIHPAESIAIDVTFTPTWYQSFRGLLDCQVTGVWDNIPGTEISNYKMVEPVSATAVQVKAEVQTPKLEILNPKNNLTCFVGVPFEWIITLRNETMLTSKFKWLQNQNKNIKVKFNPNEGELYPNQIMEIRLELICTEIGEFYDFSFYCQVDDMVEDQGVIKIQLDVLVRDIDVSFYLPGNEKSGLNLQSIFTTRKIQGEYVKLPHVSEGSNDLIFDFGSDCPIFSTRMRTFTIRNMSASTSTFKIRLEKFTATEQESEHLKAESTSKEISKHENLLNPTLRTKLGFSSKSGQSYISTINKVRQMIQQMHDLLGDGRGAAFRPTPSEGKIGPWEEIKIEIISYNNLVGVYEDTLHCQIGENIKESMRVRLAVIGTAVKFSGAQLVSNKKNVAGWIDRINFGARVINPVWKGGDGVRIGTYSDEDNRQNAEMFSKTIMIENQSPRSVIMHWKIFIRHCLPSEQLGDAEVLDSNKIQVEDMRLKDDETGVFEVNPKNMTIPAFKTVPFKVSFRSAVEGAYDGLVVAEASYVEPDGSLRKAPVLPGSKLYVRSLARLHIQAKVTQPRLTLEECEFIKIKRILVGAQKESRANVFLKNKSDAICSFYLDATPSEHFHIKTSNSKRKEIPSNCIIKANSNQDRPMFELKPTEQMLVVINYQEIKWNSTELTIKNKLIDIEESVMEDEAKSDFTANKKKRQYCSRGELTVTFSNGMVQSFQIMI